MNNIKNIEQLRGDTPGCSNVIFANNAGASLSSRNIWNAINSYQNEELEFGALSAEITYRDRIDQFYALTAELIGAKPNEISWATSATHAWNMAFSALDLRDGDRIITHQTEYASNSIAMLRRQQEVDFNIDHLEFNTDGSIDPTAVKNKITPKTKFISVTHVPTQGGCINDIETVGAISREFGIPYLVDASLSVGQLNLDIKDINCDFLCGAGRKFLRGPRGSGFLYCNGHSSNSINMPQPIDVTSINWRGGSNFDLKKNANKFETLEYSAANKYGLALATKQAVELGTKWIEQRTSELGLMFRSGIDQIPNLQSHQVGVQRGGVVSFACDKMSCVDLVDKLFEQGIEMTSIPSIYSPLAYQEKKMHDIMRASFHYFNTEQEVDDVLMLIREITKNN